jgi:hypothetical protein
MALMNVASAKKSAWAREACGRYLARVLLQPHGVQSILEFLLQDCSNEGKIDN